MAVGQAEGEFEAAVGRVEFAGDFERAQRVAGGEVAAQGGGEVGHFVEGADVAGVDGFEDLFGDEGALARGDESGAELGESERGDGEFVIIHGLLAVKQQRRTAEYRITNIES